MALRYYWSATTLKHKACLILFVENKYIEDQVKSEVTCSQNNSICHDEIKYSICHPLGFCYCPDSTVKTEVQLDGGDTETQCLAGKGNVNAMLKLTSFLSRIIIYYYYFF